MIEINSAMELSSVVKNIDMNKTLLITGPAESYKHSGKILYFDTEEAVEETYGQSRLLNAFIAAKRSGAEHVFLCNIQSPREYIDLSSRLRHYDFAYVAPIDIYLGSAFHDASQKRKKIFYSSYLLEDSYLHNQTTFVFTENHAELYEDIDEFLEDMKKTEEDVSKSTRLSSDLSSLIFVLNNQAGDDMANVNLASALSVMAPGSFPEARSSNESIYDIDLLDIGNTSQVVFRKDTLQRQRIENLVNFLPVGNPRKSVAVDMIVKHITRNLDLDSFKGKPYTGYVKIKVEDEIVRQLTPLLGTALRSFEIKSVRFEKEGAGVGSIYCDIDIWVYCSVERVSVSLGGEA